MIGGRRGYVISVIPYSGRFKRYFLKRKEPLSSRKWGSVSIFCTERKQLTSSCRHAQYPCRFRRATGMHINCGYHSGVEILLTLESSLITIKSKKKTQIKTHSGIISFLRMSVFPSFSWSFQLSAAS